MKFWKKNQNIKTMAKQIHDDRERKLNWNQMENSFLKKNCCLNLQIG